MRKNQKIMRDNNGKINKQHKEDLKKELGDILCMCSELKLTMNEVAETNINKLLSRKQRGKLKGSGDER